MGRDSERCERRVPRDRRETAPQGRAGCSSRSCASVHVTRRSGFPWRLAVRKATHFSVILALEFPNGIER